MGDRRPKVGLALSSGAVRGMAHLGVLQVFEEENIPIDFIAGTSAGSLVGGLYALGLDLKYLIQLASNIKWEHITDITIPRRGLIAGKKLVEFLKFITQEQSFTELKIPFTAVATDIETGERVLLDSGLVADAIRASSSIPGIYVPYRLRGRQLVDGALVDRVPISVVQDMGAEVVLAVDVGFGIAHTRPRTIFEVLFQSTDIMLREVSRERCIGADVLIRPAVSHLPGIDFRNVEKIMKAGRTAAREKLPEIKELLGVG